MINEVQYILIPQKCFPVLRVLLTCGGIEISFILQKGGNAAFGGILR